jgi:hypothetical protein
MIVTIRTIFWSGRWASLAGLLLLVVGVLGARALIAAQDMEPRLTLVPSSGAAGIAVQARGEGFTGDCGVELFFDSTDAQSLGFASVGEDGTFAAQITIPEEAAPGEHQVVAHGSSLGTTGPAVTRLAPKPADCLSSSQGRRSTITSTCATGC